MASAITFGTPYPNGTWSPGIMADLQNNVIDITMPAVARAADRDVLADPIPAISVLPVNILAGRNRTRETNVAGYLLTFDPQVWAMLLFFLAFLSIVMISLDAISRKMRRQRASVFEMWNQHFWMLFENMFCEASAEMPERTDLRLVSAVWWIAIVVLMNAFAGQMRACLMVKSELKRINTLADIAEKPHLKVYLLKNTVASRYLESSQGAAERKVWSMIRRDRTDLFGLLRFPEEMVHEIVQEKAVVIHAGTISQNETDCLLVFEARFYPFSPGFQKRLGGFFGSAARPRLGKVREFFSPVLLTAASLGVSACFPSR
ncbi:glutamate receptor ionotropic, kainate 5 [Rhipicephalus sanguineus]|uniref:glutamate receptor ionotropic, kainate 5 n=1 Tax=Rhipicephalus sanguineus TaxID=34632 RepID=UPI0020C41917|nr:glutamate receptor ionotropic, kainate 5 [Rhipicephalus sanguineus]